MILQHEGRLWEAANQAAQVTTVALATTYTGLCVYNPQSSNVQAHILRVGVGLSVAPAAISVIGLMVGFHASTNVTHTSALTPYSCYTDNGGAAKYLRQCGADYSSTLPTAPTLRKVLMGGFTAAALPNPTLAYIALTEGEMVLGPGAYACIYTLTAVTGFFSMLWCEVPINY